MAIFLDAELAHAVADIVENDDNGVIYLCHAVPHFEKFWQEHTSAGTLGQYLRHNFMNQLRDYEATLNRDDISSAVSIRAHIIRTMPPLAQLGMDTATFGRELDAAINDFFEKAQREAAA